MQMEEEREIKRKVRKSCYDVIEVNVCLFKL